MTKQDWIILRLTKAASPFVHKLKGKQAIDDLVNSVMYLVDKYGKKHVFDCIDQLKKERNPYETN